MPFQAFMDILKPKDRRSGVDRRAGQRPEDHPERRDSDRRSGTNRRGKDRMSVELVTDSGHLVTGSVVDISTNGICVILDRPVKKKEQLSLMSGKPGQSPQKRRCQVAWVKAEDNGLYRAGLYVLG